MNDPTRTATAEPASGTDQEPGHYGPGYGEQVPDDAPPQLGPASDGDRPPGLPDGAPPNDGSPAGAR